MILDVWQIKELRTHFSDVWQIQRLEVEGLKLEVRGRAKAAGKGYGEKGDIDEDDLEASRRRIARNC
jgi:hypothetical protein